MGEQMTSSFRHLQPPPPPPSPPPSRPPLCTSPGSHIHGIPSRRIRTAGLICGPESGLAQPGLPRYCWPPERIETSAEKPGIAISRDPSPVCSTRSLSKRRHWRLHNRLQYRHIPQMKTCCCSRHHRRSRTTDPHRRMPDEQTHPSRWSDVSFSRDHRYCWFDARTPLLRNQVPSSPPPLRNRADPRCGLSVVER
jgi:hypothetical protein